MSVGTHRAAVPRYIDGTKSPCPPMTLVLGTQRKTSRIAINDATITGLEWSEDLTTGWVVEYGKLFMRHILKYLGLATLALHFVDPCHLGRAQAARLHHQAPCLGVPKGRCFLALLHRPKTRRFKGHIQRLKGVFTPPPPRSKARMPPVSKA